MSKYNLLACSLAVLAVAMSTPLAQADDYHYCKSQLEAKYPPIVIPNDTGDPISSKLAEQLGTLENSRKADFAKLVRTQCGLDPVSLPETPVAPNHSRAPNYL